MSVLVKYGAQGGLATITLSDPPANTYTYEMMQQLDTCILKARMDNDVHVIILRGDGEKFFSAGANINMLNTVDPTFKYFFCLHANETLSRLEQTPKLVIAALNGHTVGGGLEIALAADMRLAKAEGGKIGLPEVTLGVLPGTGGTQRGIVTEIFPAVSFDEDVLAYAKQFVPPLKASKAVGRIKRSLCSGLEVPFSEGLAIERELQQALFTSADGKEGITAYVEKRRPQFTGA